MTTISEIVGDYSMSGTRRAQSPGNLRAGRSVRGSHSSILHDAERDEELQRQDLEALPRASILLVTKGDKILTVSSDSRNKNLPGGTVESGETPEDAALRELWEETGLIASEIFHIYTRVNDGYLVSTFRVVDVSGKIRSSSEGIVSWSNPEEILRSEYGEYFSDVIAALIKSSSC